jgi:20S proteasome subunit beta 6
VQRTLLPLDTVIRIIKDAFASAAERETQTGDYLEMFIIRNEGITVERFDLKKD